MGRPQCPEDQRRLDEARLRERLAEAVEGLEPPANLRGRIDRRVRQRRQRRRIATSTAVCALLVAVVAVTVPQLGERLTPSLTPSLTPNNGGQVVVAGPGDEEGSEQHVPSPPDEVDVPDDWVEVSIPGGWVSVPESWDHTWLGDDAELTADGDCPDDFVGVVVAASRQLTSCPEGTGDLAEGLVVAPVDTAPHAVETVMNYGDPDQLPATPVRSVTQRTDQAVLTTGGEVRHRTIVVAPAVGSGVVVEAVGDSDDARLALQTIRGEEPPVGGAFAVSGVRAVQADGDVGPWVDPEKLPFDPDDVHETALALSHAPNERVAAVRAGGVLAVLAGEDGRGRLVESETLPDAGADGAAGPQSRPVWAPKRDHVAWLLPGDEAGGPQLRVLGWRTREALLAGEEPHDDLVLPVEGLGDDEAGYALVDWRPARDGVTVLVAAPRPRPSAGPPTPAELDQAGQRALGLSFNRHGVLRAPEDPVFEPSPDVGQRSRDDYQ